jgi:hypothetical protein
MPPASGRTGFLAPVRSGESLSSTRRQGRSRFGADPDAYRDRPEIATLFLRSQAATVDAWQDSGASPWPGLPPVI